MTNAVIDIGTNTIILLIAKVVRKSIKVLHDEAVITRLGQGLSDNHFFLSEAMNRTLSILKKFKETCTAHGVEKIIVVGTAAFRNSANTEVFEAKVKNACGFKISILSGNDEASLVFGAAFNDFGTIHNKLIVVDIGGGSTEIITGPYRKKKTPEAVISLPLGSVSQTELTVHSDPISDEDYNRLCQQIRNGLKDSLDDFYPKTFLPKEYTLIATAGTATSLAALDQKMAEYKPGEVHGYVLKKNRLEWIGTALKERTVNARQKMPGMEPLRADVILTGAVLLNEIMNYFDQTKAIISDHGLRYGVFYKKFVK